MAHADGPGTKKLERRYRVRPDRVRLTEEACGDTAGVSKDDAKKLLARGLERLGDLQDRLYAQDRWSVLLIFQSMDAAGKDSTIKNVMSGHMPQGFQVFSFQQPSREELDHDWLWRGYTRLPERGRIGIHNRSWYEEMLVVRVHPEILESQKIPKALVGKRIWEERFESVNDLERHLARNGTVVRKFFLHVSRDEQRRRFLRRLERPDKRWKFSPHDVAERAHWDAYTHAYQEVLRATSTEHAPWYVIPADHKWFMRLAVAAVLEDTLEGLGLTYPKVHDGDRAAFEAARLALGKEDGKARAASNGAVRRAKAAPGVRRG